MKGTELELLVIGAGLIGAVALIATLASSSDSQFLADHNCVKVGEIAPSVSTVVAPTLVGNTLTIVPTTVYTPGRTGWKCDDDKTYWR